MAIIKRWPQTLAVPLIVFGLLCGLGVWGVYAASKNEASHARDNALGAAIDAATGFQVSQQTLSATSSALNREMEGS